jgi:hypothetical protein
VTCINFENSPIFNLVFLFISRDDSEDSFKIGYKDNACPKGRVKRNEEINMDLTYHLTFGRACLRSAEFKHGLILLSLKRSCDLRSSLLALG